MSQFSRTRTNTPHALTKLGERDMIRSFEERLEQFQRREVERAQSAGLAAYILNEDGSVVRISPDGKKDLIVGRLGRRQRQPIECSASRL